MQIIPFILIIVSDRAARGDRPDETIPRVQQWIVSKPYEMIDEYIVADESREIENALKAALSNTEVVLVITSGGTGFSARDITPEVTAKIVEKRTPGIDEYLRAEGRKKTVFSVLSRGISGIAGNKLVINLPGKPDSVIEALATLMNVLPHALKLLQGASTDSDHGEKNSK